MEASGLVSNSGEDEARAEAARLRASVSPRTGLSDGALESPTRTGEADAGVGRRANAREEVREAEQRGRGRPSVLDQRRG